MMKPNEEKISEFMVKLTALSNEYGLVIKSCGCFASPWIESVDTTGSYAVEEAGDWSDHFWEGMKWSEE